MTVLIWGLATAALGSVAILAALVVLRIATRSLDGSQSATPIQKVTRRLMGVYVRRPDEINERDKVGS